MSQEPLYRQILGSEFAALDEPVRRFHSLQGHHRLHGRCTVNGAEHAVGRFVCAMLGLPRRISDAEFQFDLEAEPDAEIWIRHFPTRTMRSRLERLGANRLRERLGPATLTFSLDTDGGCLSMRLQSIRVLGLPWPRRWFPEVWAFESGDRGRFCFDVGARLRTLGALVAYSGYLEIDVHGEPP